VPFVVNGADWCFDGMDSNDVGKAIEKALSFVATSFERNEAVQIGDDFQERHMLGTLPLWELFAADSGLHLPGELRQELAAWLGRAELYADLDQWPEGVEDSLISVGTNPPAENADVAWVHHSVRAGAPSACFTLNEAFVERVSSSKGASEVHFVCDDLSRKSFWRHVIVLRGDNHLSLADFADKAYPNLHFVEGAIQGVNNLRGGYNAAKKSVRISFEILDDKGEWVFTCPPPAMSPSESGTVSEGENPTNQLIENRFSGFGLTVAPENPNVYLDKKCREAREAVLDDLTIYCQWHIKLEPHRNRIHIHHPVQQSGGKVVVGIIDEHLPLP